MPNTNERDALTYPEGFDEFCGLPAWAMQAANEIGASLTGDRKWDVPCIARALAATAPNAGAPMADGWIPTADSINALPQLVRDYIHALETNADPAGMVRENAQLKDANEAVQRMYRRAADALAEVKGCFDAAAAEGLAEALAETQDERLKDLVERRLMYALAAAPAQQTGARPDSFEPAFQNCRLTAAEQHALWKESEPTPGRTHSAGADLTWQLGVFARKLIEAAQQAGAPELLRGWTRYEKTRKLSPIQWADLHARNLAGEAFDDMIDALPSPSTPIPSGAPLPVAPSDAEDARRYRVLRNNLGSLDVVMLRKSSDGTQWLTGAALDQSIDALATPPQATLPASEAESIWVRPDPDYGSDWAKGPFLYSHKPRDGMFWRRYTRAQPQADAVAKGGAS